MSELIKIRLHNALKEIASLKSQLQSAESRVKDLLVRDEAQASHIQRLENSQEAKIKSAEEAVWDAAIKQCILCAGEVKINENGKHWDPLNQREIDCYSKKRIEAKQRWLEVRKNRRTKPEDSYWHRSFLDVGKVICDFKDCKWDGLYGTEQSARKQARRHVRTNHFESRKEAK